MKKTLRYFAFITLCAVGASIPFFIKADIFDELFKGVDFEQMAKDMEKMFGDKEDAKEAGPKMEPIPSKTATAETSTDKSTTESAISTKDRRTLFIDPDMQTLQIKGKSITEPNKTSRNALSSYKQEMDEKLSVFEKNVEANKNLSPQFKEKIVPELKKRIDEIVVASEMIDSKKVYQKIFLTPPAGAATKSTTGFGSSSEKKQDMFASPSGKMNSLQDSMKQLRQKYLALIDELDRLNKKIAVTEEEESKEEDKDILEELAGQGQTELPTYTPLAPQEPKIRGVKPTPAVKSTAKKATPVKQSPPTPQASPVPSQPIQFPTNPFDQEDLMGDLR